MNKIHLELADELIEVIARRATDMMREERRFLSKEALAQHLGVSERRIKTLREHGLPARKTDWPRPLLRS